MSEASPFRPILSSQQAKPPPYQRLKSSAYQPVCAYSFLNSFGFRNEHGKNVTLLGRIKAGLWRRFAPI
jgi:hypothetical protein